MNTNIYSHTFCFDGTPTDLNISQFDANQIFHPDRKFSYLPCVSEAKYKMLQCYGPNEMNYAWPEIWVHWHLYITPGIIYRATTPGKEDGRGIRDELVRGSKASLNSNPLWALLRCTVIGLKQPSSSALCCPAAQLLHSSPNSFVLCAMIWNSRQFAIQNFHCTTACWTVHWRTFSVRQSSASFAEKKKKTLVILDW